MIDLAFVLALVLIPVLVLGAVALGWWLGGGPR